jgi:hypothetical protein
MGLSLWIAFLLCGCYTYVIEYNLATVRAAQYTALTSSINQDAAKIERQLQRMRAELDANSK